MFCPKCGVRNLEDAKFCRACGADIRLVPQALAGRLPEGASGLLEVEGPENATRRKRRKKLAAPPTLEKGIESIFGGVAFLLIVMLGFVYFRGAFLIWIWFIIPALGHVGKGIGQIIRSRRDPHALAPFSPVDVPPAPAARELPAPDTSEIVTPPPSVTESTTRHLATPARRAVTDA